jgi:uncharacterized protein
MDICRVRAAFKIQDRRMKLQRILLLLTGLIGTAANAASFDCELARSRVETLVCADSGLAKLDEELAAMYARSLKLTNDRKAEKAMQLAWLRIRGACNDSQCIRHTYESRIAELRGRIASASPFVGFWKIEYSCAGATGVFEERCAKGERDVFTLAIQMNGDQVCITHMATAQMHNRVDGGVDDDVSMTGHASGKVASVKFRSAWGGAGTATLRIDRNVLDWKVETKDGGTSWIPDVAELRQIPAARYERLPECAR